MEGGLEDKEEVNSITRYSGLKEAHGKPSTHVSSSVAGCAWRRRMRRGRRRKNTLGREIADGGGEVEKGGEEG